MWLRYNRILVAALTLFLLMALGGCVYLRLLEFKNQLTQFDENFSTKVEDGFILHFKDPMLYEKDVVYLSEVKPSLKMAFDSGERWVYRFERIALDKSPVPPGPALVFEMEFNKDEMLDKIVFAEVLLQIIPPKFLEISLRSLGHAKVDTKKRHVKAELGDVDKKILRLPNRDEVEDNLGQPLEVEDVENGEERLLYVYHLKGADRELKEDEPGRAVARLYFDKSTGQLLQAKCKFAGLKLSIDYRQWIKQSEDVAAS